MPYYPSSWNVHYICFTPARYEKRCTAWDCTSIHPIQRFVRVHPFFHSLRSHRARGTPSHHLSRTVQLDWFRIFTWPWFITVRYLLLLLSPFRYHSPLSKICAIGSKALGPEVKGPGSGWSGHLDGASSFGMDSYPHLMWIVAKVGNTLGCGDIGLLYSVMVSDRILQVQQNIV